jgi:hypothetical protein
MFAEMMAVFHVAGHRRRLDHAAGISTPGAWPAGLIAMLAAAIGCC